MTDVPQKSVAPLTMQCKTPTAATVRRFDEMLIKP
jgi:hypothetical protein